MTAFIERFGHLSDSGNDFSKEPWRETPDLVLRMVIDRGNRLDDRPQTRRVYERMLQLFPDDRWTGMASVTPGMRRMLSA